MNYHKCVPVKVNKPLKWVFGKSKLYTDLGTRSIHVTISKCAKLWSFAKCINLKATK